MKKKIIRYTKRQNFIKAILTNILPAIIMIGIISCLASQFLIAGICLVCTFTIGGIGGYASIKTQQKLEELWEDKHYLEQMSNSEKNKEVNKKYTNKKLITNSKKVNAENQETKTTSDHDITK